MDRDTQDALRLADNAVGLLRKLAPGRPDLIFSALVVALIQAVAAVYDESAAAELLAAIDVIKNKRTTPIFSA